MTNTDWQFWTGLWERLGGQGDVRGIYDDLIARYSEPQRAYHNLEHIRHCLEELDSVRNLAANPDVVELAIWYHDAVYDPRNSDNEERSAMLAVDALRNAGLPDHLGEQVTDLILATKHTKRPTLPDARLMVDIDLSIFGQPQEKFDEYERQIRQEYDWLPEAEFVAGRSAILRSFVNRPKIYSTPWFRKKYETRAGNNLVRSLVIMLL